MQPTISVVVPTCGRPQLLERCLRALERQTLPREAFEIIVIEDLARQGPAVARNRGWRQARASLIAFTDDDTVPDEDWLRRGLDVFKWEPRTDVVCGRVIMPLSGKPTDYERDAQGLERAEFVTAKKIADLLLASGVDHAQGYPFGRPRPINEILPPLPFIVKPLIPVYLALTTNFVALEGIVGHFPTIAPFAHGAFNAVALDQVFSVSGIDRPDVPPTGAVNGGRGRDGRHTEAMGRLLAEMQVVARAHPMGTW